MRRTTSAATALLLTSSAALAILVFSATASFSQNVGEGDREVDEAFARAMNANDADALAVLYAEDAVAYPPGGELQQRGRAAIRRGFERLFSAFTVKGFTMKDAAYATSGDISTGWGTWAMTLVPRHGGTPIEMAGRGTSVSRRVGGRWLYVVDHASVPAPPPGR